MQRRKDFDPLLLKGGLQFLERSLKGFRDFQRVGPWEFFNDDKEARLVLHDPFADERVVPRRQIGDLMEIDRRDAGRSAPAREIFESTRFRAFAAAMQSLQLFGQAIGRCMW